jgi:twitching motility protein PilT
LIFDEERDLIISFFIIVGYGWNRMELTSLLQLAFEHHASDLYLSTGLVPYLRVDGVLQALSLPVLDKALIQEMLRPWMSQDLYNTEVDFVSELQDVMRFRGHVFQHHRGVSAVFRLIPFLIPTLETLGLPLALKKVMHYPKGLVLVTGPTGSGKSTTLAALLDYVNTTCRLHVVTLEDPIEFVHSSRQSIIHQREVYRDTASFQQGLKAVLREDPDVVFVGELRDAETIRLALTAAETGHLVLATLHTNSATATIHRLVDVFSGDDKAWIRGMLAESLQAVIAQVLVKKKEGGRVAVMEMMLASPAIRHLIREDKIEQLQSVIETSQAQGMMTAAQHLKRLYAEGVHIETEGV